MKKILSITLLLVLMVVLSGCENYQDKKLRLLRECEGDEICIEQVVGPKKTNNEKNFEAARKSCNGKLKSYKDDAWKDPEFECEGTNE